jgi:spore coat polysaccharide biosynthesis predicted glycosyltransferase SpsG
MPFKTTVYVNAEIMADLMAVSDIAISGGGGTTWELFCMGLPTITIIMAENQREIIRDLAERKIVLLVEQNESFKKNLLDQVSKLEKDFGLRKSIIDEELKIIDGLGCERVVNIILENGVFTENHNQVNENRKLL